MPRKSSPSSGLTDTWGRQNRRLVDKPCETCGKTFRPRRSAARFCSRPCMWKQNGGKNAKDESWWINPRGYIEGRVLINGVRVYRKQHRWIMEQHIKRPLLTTEDVHHIDGNKSNNSIDNLVLITHGQHSVITGTSRTHKRGIKHNLTDAERMARSMRAKKLKLNEQGIAAKAKAKLLAEGREVTG